MKNHQQWELVAYEDEDGEVSVADVLDEASYAAFQRASAEFEPGSRGERLAAIWDSVERTLTHARNELVEAEEFDKEVG
jgi:hypothetical protein